MQSFASCCAADKADCGGTNPSTEYKRQTLVLDSGPRFVLSYLFLCMLGNPYLRQPQGWDLSTSAGMTDVRCVDTYAAQSMLDTAV